MAVLDPRTLSFEELLEREWLLVDGFGSFASSTAVGLNTRKYHGVLVAATKPPLGRIVAVSRVEETIVVAGRSTALASVEYPGVIHPAGHSLIRAFEPTPYPRWLFQADDWTLKKSLRFSSDTPGEVVLTYTLLGGGNDDRDDETWRGESAPAKPSIELTVRPLLAVRPIHELAYRTMGRFDAPPVDDERRTVQITGPSLASSIHIAHDGVFAAAPDWYLSTVYRRERERGYAAQEDLWTPGVITLSLSPGRPKCIVFALSPIDLEKARHNSGTRAGHRPFGKTTSTAHDDDLAVSRILEDASAQFRAPPLVIPQYPWSALSTRDVLIALPGILLTHARFSEAASILTSLAKRLNRGLLPSVFSEAGDQPAGYESADASLWLIHAIWSYFEASGDADTVRSFWPAIGQILDAYVAGTKTLGIGLDGDMLLRVREGSIGTTWMNAKVGSSVITPRNGRPVELNALWYNALVAAAELAERAAPVGANSSTIERLRSAAAIHRLSFNRRFWNNAGRCLFDVVYDNGVDGSIRPNQLLAASLPFAVLDDRYRPAMLRTVRDKLLTPFGLRTLDPADSAYRGRYAGDVQSRDRAYHQGSVFPWLIGPYVTGLSRTIGRGPRTAKQVRAILGRLIEHMSGDGLGQLPELFDGDMPHRPGGATADARSVGELARVWQSEVVDAPKSELPNVGGTPQLSETTLGTNPT